MYKFKFKIYKLLPNHGYQFDHDIVVSASDKFQAQQLASNMFEAPDYKLES